MTNFTERVPVTDIRSFFVFLIQETFKWINIFFHQNIQAWKEFLNRLTTFSFLYLYIFKRRHF